MLTHLATVAAVAAVLLAPALLALWTRQGRLYHSPWPALAAVLLYGSLALHIAHANVTSPYIWDFGCFWLFGHIAAAGSNIYDPAVFHAFPSIEHLFRSDSYYNSQVLDVAFPYPPPSVFLFLPLGYFRNITAAMYCWYAIQFAALIAAAVILQRSLFPKERAITVLIVALTLIIPMMQVNTKDAQLMTLSLLFVALTFAGRFSNFGTIWTVLAVWVKPFAAALLLADIARRHGWRLFIAGLTVAFSSLVALGFLGPKTMLTYFASPPNARSAVSLLNETENQSLLSIIMRSANHGRLDAPLSHPVLATYLILAALLVGVTWYLCARAPNGDPLAFCLALMVGLIIYPHSSALYGVTAVVPLLVLWTIRERLPLGTLGAGVVVGLTILLQGHFRSVFSANLLLWVCCAYALIGTLHSARQAAHVKPQLANNVMQLT